MVKNIKRVMSLLLGMTIILSTSAWTAFGAPEEFCVMDDFSSGISCADPGGKFNDNWNLSPAGAHTQPTAPTTAAIWDGSGNLMMRNEVENGTPKAVSLNSPYAKSNANRVIQVDVYPTRAAWGSLIGGIMLPTDAGTVNEWKNAYSLYFSTGDPNRFVFETTTNGTYVQYNSNDDTDYVPSFQTWYTLKIIIYNSDLYVSVTETATGTTVWQLTLTGMNTLDYSAGNGGVLLFDGSPYTDTIFDNFTLRNATMDDLAEKDTVIYQDAAGGKIVSHSSSKGMPYQLDLGESHRIVKVAVKSLENDGGTLSLKASKDGITWTTLKELNETGNILWYNRVTTDAFRYVKIEREEGSEAFGFSKICVLSELDLTKSIELAAGQSLYLYPRIGGSDVPGSVQWSVNNDGIISVSGDTITAVREGIAKVSTDYNGINTSLSIISSASTVMADDFEYHAAASVTGEAFGTKWLNSTADHGWTENTVNTSTVTDPVDPSNMVLQINHSAGSTGILLKDVMPSLGTSRNIQFDMRGSFDTLPNGAPVQWYGINVGSDGGSPLSYRLQYQDYADGSGGCFYFAKWDNGTALYSAQSNVAGLKGSDWYTVNLAFNGSLVSWKISFKDGSEIWQGSYNDSSVIDVSSSAYEFYSFANNDVSANSYFDNFVMKKYDAYIDSGTEPNTVMYENLTGGKSTAYSTATGAPYELDIEKAATIRKIIVNGFTNSGSDLTLKLSADKRNWISVANLSSSGDFTWLNTLTVNEYRYIKIERLSGTEAFGFDEVKVLANFDLSSDIYLDIDSSIYLYPRIGGNDVLETAAWSVTDASVAEFSNCRITGKWTGTAKITATNRNENIAFNIVVGGASIVQDSFENYTASVSANGVKFRDIWETATTHIGDQSVVIAETVADPSDVSNNILQLSYGNSYTGIKFADSYPVMSSSREYKIDMCGDFTTLTEDARWFGIFVGDSDTANTTAYRLGYADYNDTKGGRFELVKTVQGQEIYRVDSSGSVADLSGNRWYSLKFIVNGNRLDWSFSEKGGNVLWDGTYTDANLLNISTSKVEMFGFCNDWKSCNVYFDNFVMKEYDSFLEGKSEPNDVMYCNVACNKPVIDPAAATAGIEYANDGSTAKAYVSANGSNYAIDLGIPYTVRRVQLVGLQNTVGVLEIAGSNDKESWTTIASTGAAGNAAEVEFNWVNTENNKKYRYVMIRRFTGDTPYSFKEFRLFTDVTDTVVPVMMNSSLYMFPRIDGNDVFTGVDWSADKIGYVYPYNHTIVEAISKTVEGPVALTATSGNNSITVNIEVKDAFLVTQIGDNLDLTLAVGGKFNELTDIPVGIVAFYDEQGALMSVEQTDIKVVNSNVNETEFTVKNNIEAASTVAFIWDGGFETIKPVISKCVVK